MAAGVGAARNPAENHRPIEANAELLREAMISREDLACRIDLMEWRPDECFRIVFEALPELMEPSMPKKGGTSTTPD